MNTINATIVEAMEAENLFGGIFKRRMLRADSWLRWKVFLRALFGLPLDDASRKVFRKFTARTDSPTAAFREAFVIAGRRSGKSFIAALVAVYAACFRNYDDELAAGEIATVLVVGADRSQCRVILGYVNALLSIPVLQKLVTNRLKESVELGRIRIEVGTCDFRSLRGSTIICAICDEVAFWRSDDSASPDVEVLRAIRPAMATIKNAVLLCISSPYGKRGALFENYRDYYGKPSNDVLVWKASSKQMNPTLPAAVIAGAYLQDPQAARSELGGEFRDDVSSFLSAEIVEARTVRGRFEIPPMPGVSYVAFTDPSGGSSDSFTLAIGFWDTPRSLAVLACLREIPAPFSPEAAVTELAGVLRKYRCYEVFGDRYAGEWTAEAFAKQNITYRTAELTRSEIYLELLPGLMSNQIELLDSARLASQLCGLERRTTRGGKDSVDHGSSGHDDLCNAAAGCLVEILRVNGVGAGYGLLAYESSGQAARDLDRAQLRPTTSTKFELQAPPCPECARPSNAIAGDAFRCQQDGIQFDCDGTILRRPTDPVAGNGCPSCGSGLYGIVAGGGHRCKTCGYQSTSPLPKNGTPRNAEQTGGGRRAGSPSGFLQGLARLLSRRK